MNKTVTTLAFIVLACLTSIAQELPQMFRFSDDSLRLIRGGVPSTGLYDEVVIDTVYLYFDQSNYWQQLIANYQSKTNIPATMVFRGETFDSVGVRFRGQTSYQFIQSSQKKSFNINLDWVKSDQEIEGYETLNLINGYEDPSFIKEALYEKCSRNNIASVKGNHVQLFINDQNWGIYINIQQLDRQHAKEWFTSRDATRWRAEKSTGGGGFGAGYCSMNWLGWDTTTYKSYYKLKNAYKPNPWDDLVNACYVLNNTPSNLLMDSLKNYLDVDGTLWFLAHEILFCDDDSYVNKGGMDYYLYYDVGTGRMIPIEYDANSCMSTQKATQWTPFFRETSTQYPLMNKLMAVPEIRQRYLAHVRTIMEESFDLAMINGVIDEYAARIDQHVQDDPKKLYTYNQFVQEIPKIKQFFSTRRNYILNNAEVNRVGPSISDVVYSVEGEPFVPPTSLQPVDVTAMVTATQGVFRVNLYFGTGMMGKFNSVQMFDDGNHNDGAAGDGIFGAQIPAQELGSWVRFYIEALANDTWKTAKFEPQGADHDVYIYTVKPGQIDDFPVVINELMSDNASAVQDPSGEYDDWVEFYNTSNEPINLSGYYLSDKLDQLNLWQFPQGTSIEQYGYLIVWCDGDETQPGLHTSFGLSKDGESLYFTTPDLLIANEVTFGASEPDLAYARIPNGIGDFVWQEHTFNAPNELTFTSPVVINELMAINTVSVPDPSSEFDDWIEFYNNSGDSVDLSGYYLSDDSNQLDKWQFPEATIIEGYGYLTVWCDNDLAQPGLHANFDLNNNGESIYFSSSTLQMANEVTYGAHAADQSFSRVPNGTGDFIWQEHTFSNHNGPFFNCQVVVNELMSDNISSVQDPDGEYDDWIEFYNNSTESFDLSGFYLSDKANELNGWPFPAGTTIEGLGYLIVWCDNDLAQTGLHADFSLSKDGEDVFLTSPFIQLLDEVTFGASEPDMAYARVPNGTGDFVWQQHTFNASNDNAVTVSETQSQSNFKFFPNPAQGLLFVELNNGEPTIISVYSLLGNIIYQEMIDKTKQINTSGWARGLYFIGAENDKMQKLILH
ncbi:MAG: lamin tail domain-containing protein [Bacteroidales bacterium]|nr:lamin tail domain-containing protein [Bacteroidales bacterium]